MAALAVLTTLALGACGQDDRPGRAQALTAPAATAPAAATTPTPTSAEDVSAIVRVVRKYLHAFAVGDARAACQTRTYEERKAFAEDGFTCPTAMGLVMRKVGPNRRLFGRVSVDRKDVEVTGDAATVVVDFPGTDDADDRADPLTLLRDHGRWLLYDGDYSGSGTGTSGSGDPAVI